MQTRSEFIDLATAPLAALPVERQRAHGELMERLHYAAERLPADPGPMTTLEQAAETLKRQPVVASARASGRRAGWAYIVLLLLLFCVHFDLALEDRISTGSSSIFEPLGLKQASDKRLAALKLGEPVFAQSWAMVPSLEMLEEQHARSPDDLVLYQALVQTRIWYGGGLPQDFEAYWRRVEPDNAFWAALQAGFLAAEVESARKKSGDSSDLAKDPAILHALALIREASHLPHYIDRRRELRERQRAAFRRPESLADDDAVTAAVSHAELLVTPSFESVIRDVCQELETIDERTTSLRRNDLVIDWERLVRIRITQPGSTLPVAPASPELYDLGWVRTAGFPPETLKPINDAAMAAARLGLGSGGGVYSLISPADALHFPRGFRNPAAVTGDPFLPRRMAEYAALDRECAIYAADFTLFLLAVVFWVGSRRAAGGVAAGLGPLFPLASTVRLLALGLVLPVLVWWGVTHVSPAGFRDYGLGYLDEFRRARPFSLWQLPFFGGPILVLCTLLTAIDRELWRRTGFLGVGRRRPWFGITMTLVALAALVAPLLIRHPSLLPRSYPDITPESVSTMLLAIPTLWLMWRTLMALRLLRLSVVAPALYASRLRLPLTLACLTLIASVPVLHQVERGWLRNDVLSSGGSVESRFINFDADRRVQALREALK